MDTRDMRVFVAVYRLKSITQAAKEQFLSPQGCSKIIQRMEAELGVQLFGRNHFGVSPTPAGDILYSRAQRIIEMLEGIKDEVGTAHLAKYTLDVASTLGISEYLSLSFFRAFAEERPLVSLRFLEGPDELALTRLKEGTAEMAVLGGVVDYSEYRSTPFTRHRPLLVINERNPLAAKPSIDYADLDGQPLAMMNGEFLSTHTVMSRLTREGVEPDIVAEAAEMALCHRLAESGDAIAVSFDFAALGGKLEHTVIRPFSDPSFWWETYLVQRLDSKPSMQAQDFRSFAQSWVQEHEPDLLHWAG